MTPPWGFGGERGGGADTWVPLLSSPLVISHPPQSQVDENPDLDNLDIVSQDAEERYFDEEEPSDAPQLE